MASIPQRFENRNGGGTDKVLRRAERGLLGGMLRDNSVIAGVLEIVGAEDYSEDANQRVHRAVCHLHAEGKLADAVTVADLLRARGEVEDVGGYSYVGALWRAAPTAQKALHYAAVVRNRSVHRRLTHCLQGHLARADNCRPPEEIAAEVIGDMETVLSRTPAPGGARANGRRAPQPVSAAQLMAEDLPEVQWSVPDLIPEGATLLAAPPKTGKSWLILGVCIAVATGGVVFGSVPVPRGACLYLALEDGKRRMRRRLKTVLPKWGGAAPDGLYLVHEWPRPGMASTSGA
jgi:DnaB-like helicase N terminal domain/AAA domain